ncbi:adenylosuccinate synthase [candidate division KSB1 bacterium]
MPVTVVVGSQWGDEGKGKIVDLLSKNSDIVARYQGGPNAGHTVVIGDNQIILHQIPSGILQDNTICVIGSGTVIDPVVLMDEIDMLKKQNYSVKGRLFISHKAHLIMPYHKLLDTVKEEKDGKSKIGTTGRGIGPAYSDKYARSGIRIVDLLDREYLRKKLQKNIEDKNQLFKHIYDSEELDPNNIIDQYVEFDQKMDEYITDVSLYLNQELKKEKNILVEGAQGTLLDIDFGTYPYVTSSHPISGGACIGLGIGPTKIDKVIGVIKAYTTRVGMGPFPTEFEEEFGEKMRQLGAEFGATTGRPRRCGWLDIVIAKYAARINGIDAFAITKMDVLQTLDSIKICTHYQYEEKVIENFPAENKVLLNAVPVYEEHPGWQSDITGCKKRGDLPVNAQKYLDRIEELTEVPIEIISVGSERNNTIFC